MAHGRVQVIAPGPARTRRFTGAGTVLRSAKDGITSVSVYRDLVDEEAVTRQVGGAPGADPQMQSPEPEGPAQAADGPRGTWDDPRVPWSGKPRRVDIVLWAGIVLSGIYYWALLPFVAPLVGTRPVLLEVLNGNTAAIISAAAFARVGHGSLVVVLLAAIPGLVKFDPLYWWAGRLWGERLIAILSGRRNRGGKYMGRVQRWGRKFTWPAVIVAPFLPIPTAIIYVVVGWAGMRLVTFLILDAIGTLLWAGLLAGLGYELGHHAVVVAQTISHYGLWISIGLIVVIVFFQVRSQRHMMQVAAQARTAAQASRGEEPAADA
jgi:membrane protein DedA with SNARE-associated domain